MAEQHSRYRPSTTVKNWFPAPLELYGNVSEILSFLDAGLPGILSNIPILADRALADSLEGVPVPAGEAVCRGQAALMAGEIHNARAILEPYATAHPHASALAGLACYALGRRQRAVYMWEVLYRIMEEDDREKPSFYNSLMTLRNVIIAKYPFFHPEADAMSVLCVGKGIDVGCGGAKTCRDAIGVDLTPYGAKGKHGGQAGVKSDANIVASGDYLPMFSNGDLDYVIARHNLEHYTDYIKTLFEWTRVLKPGGMMGLVVPDHEWVDTIRLDPTHYHVFTTDSLRRLLSFLPYIEPVEVDTLAPRWSLMAVARKTPADKPYSYTAEYNRREASRCLKRARVYISEKNMVMAEECEKEAAGLADYK